MAKGRIASTAATLPVRSRIKRLHHVYNKATDLICAHTGWPGTSAN